MTSAAEQGNFQDLRSFQQLVESRFASLPRKMKEVAQFCFESPDRIALDNLTDLSRRTEMHPSAFVRFAQFFGFSGFSDLQKLYRNELRLQMGSYQSRLDTLQKADSNEVFDSLTSSASRSADKLKDQLDRKILDQAVQAIARARVIWLAGSGRTASVQCYLHYLFTGLAMHNHLLNSNHELALKQVELMQQDDLLIVPSFHPYGKTSVAIFQVAMARQIPTVTLTDNRLSPIFCPLSLLYSEDEFAGFRSLSATMSLALYLAVQAGRHRQESVETFSAPLAQSV